MENVFRRRGNKTHKLSHKWNTHVIVHKNVHDDDDKPVRIQ